MAPDNQRLATDVISTLRGPFFLALMRYWPSIAKVSQSCRQVDRSAIFWLKKTDAVQQYRWRIGHKRDNIL